MKDYPENSVSTVLQELKTPPPGDDDFRHALRQRLLTEDVQDVGLAESASWLRRHPILVGVLSGVVTTAVILVVAIKMPQFQNNAPSVAQSAPAVAATKMPKKPVAQTTDPTHRVPSRRVALIKFHFSSEVAVTDVDMRIQLPQGLKFWSQGKELVQSQVAWMSNLKPGVNTIPVAVYALAKGRYDVVATAEVDGKTIQHKVILEVIDEA